MKRKLIRFIGCCLIIVLTGCLTVGIAACSKKTAVPTTATITPTLSSIALTPIAPANLSVGSTLYLTATGTYSDGSTENITNYVTWTSSEKTVVTISPFGVVTGVGGGTANVIAVLSGVSSSPMTLTVIALSSITVTPNPPDNLAVGSVQQFTAIGTYSDGITADISSEVTWVSENTDIATISTTGLAFGSRGGTSNITASYEGITSQAVVLNVISQTSTTSVTTTSASTTTTTAP